MSETLIDIIERSDMIFQMLLFTHLFCSRCVRKKHFLLRVFCGAVVCLLGNLLCMRIFTSMWSTVIGTFPLLLLIAGNIYFCYESNLHWILQVIVMAFLIQGITFGFYVIAQEYDPVGSFASHMIIYLILVAVMFVIIRRSFGKLLPQLMEYPIPARMLAGLFFADLLLSTIFTYYLVDNDLGQGSGLVFVSWKLMTSICLILLLWMVKWISERDQILAEQRNLEYILESRRQQYEISKENLEVLRIKLHDVKHMLQNRSAAYDEEIEKALNLYSSVVKTDNEVLDTILSEKKLQCEHLGIHIEYIIDSGNLGDLTVAETGAVFGNILDNAIEAASAIEDPELRVIHLAVRNTGSLISIHEENFYSGERRIEDGQFETTKEDSFLHGLGLKSIRKIIENHGGTMEIRAEDSVFNMNILLPVNSAG